MYSRSPLHDTNTSPGNLTALQELKTLGGSFSISTEGYIANMTRHVIGAKTKRDVSKVQAPKDADWPALSLTPPDSNSLIPMDSYTRGQVPSDSASKGLNGSNVQSPASHGYTPLPRASSSSGSALSSSDQDLLPSRLDKDSAAVFSNDPPNLSRHQSGARMVRNGRSKKFSILADGIASSPSPHMIDPSTMSKPPTMSDPFTDFDNPKQMRLVIKKPIVNGSMSNTNRMQHHRNKTTISDTFNIADSNTEQNQSFLTRPQFSLHPSLTEGLKEHFPSASGKLFSVPDQQTLIKRQPLVMSNPPNDDGYISGNAHKMHFRTPDLVASFSFRNSAELSSQFDKLSLSSDYSSSTVADESWNPVEEFIGNSSSDEELNSRYGVSLFDAKAHLGTLPKPTKGLNKDPSEMSFTDVRQAYPLDHDNMAGHKDDTAVWDAAYVSGKAPDTELEWTSVQLVSKHGITSLSSGAVSLADTASLADTSPLADIAPLADLASLATSADLADPHDSETDLDEQAMPAGKVYDNLVLTTINGEDVLKGFLYGQPTQTIRVIAEDAGSVFDYSNGSDGDNEGSPLIEHDVSRPVDANIPITNDEDSDEKFPIRGDGFFPTITPSQFQRSHSSNRQTGFPHERNDSTGNTPKLPHMHRHRQNDLDHNFQFPVRDGDSQYMMSTPLLNKNEDVPEAKYEHRSPVRRVLNTLKIKKQGSGKLVKHRTEPRKSFLRRQMARLDTFLDRKNW
jgi:hypothetical protein